jgi:putative DNA primase/helicase
MIAGCVAWQREGLAMPAAVLHATNEYMDEESDDVLTMWLADYCTVEAEAKSTPDQFYQSFKSYSERAEEKVTTSTSSARN